MKLIKPKKLCPGDTVAAISLSWGGPGEVPERYKTGKQQFMREFDLKVIETRHALRPASWLAANPKARADDLMEAFSDPNIRAIISTIGGDDSIRILPFIEPKIIQANPKIFLGYSDTTVTHLACLAAGLTTFYGPSFLSGFAENTGMFPYMVSSLRRALFDSTPPGVISPNLSGWTNEHLDWAIPSNQQIARRLQPSTGWNFLSGQGVAEGPLIGGCLEVLSWIRGTSAWPPLSMFDGSILFLETSEEGLSPALVARELRTLASLGILERLRGLLFGRPGGQVSASLFPAYDQAVLKVIHDEQGLANLPIVTQMDFGHTDPIMTLPYGVRARIDIPNQQVSILESGVTD